MSEQKIETSATLDNFFSSKLTYFHNSKKAVKFELSCLKQSKISFTPKYVVNIFIFYELDTLSGDFTLKGCLLGAVKLTQNSDYEKYFYSVYGTGFCLCLLRLVSNFNFDENVAIFSVASSYSRYAGDRKEIF